MTMTNLMMTQVHAFSIVRDHQQQLQQQYHLSFQCLHYDCQSIRQQRGQRRYLATLTDDDMDDQVGVVASWMLKEEEGVLSVLEDDEQQQQEEEDNDLLHHPLLTENGGDAQETMIVSLLPHKPLGCTIEESLADGQYVFLSHVTPGGSADQAGLQVGDVILACTNFFGTSLQSVSTTTTTCSSSTTNNNNMELVLDLIRARPNHEVLELKIARGTFILEQHEQALVELCTNPNGDDGISSSKIEECMLDYLKQAYNDDNNNDDKEESFLSSSSFLEQEDKEQEDKEECIVSDNDDDDNDCILDNVLDLWNQDLDVLDPTNRISKQSTETIMDGMDDNNNKNKKSSSQIKPWSSRSSPSGTFVRDPKTGQMKNVSA